MSDIKVISKSDGFSDVTYYENDQVNQLLKNAATSEENKCFNRTKHELEELLAIVVIQREIHSLLTAFSEEHECFICDHQEVYDKISDVEKNIIYLNMMLRELKTKIIENYYDI